jgi:hypothetical protein
MLELSATSPLAAQGEKKEAVDVFVVNERGRITQLNVYYL